MNDDLIDLIIDNCIVVNDKKFIVPFFVWKRILDYLSYGIPVNYACGRIQISDIIIECRPKFKRRKI